MLLEIILKHLQLYLDRKINKPDDTKFSMSAPEVSWISKQFDKIFSYFKQTFPEYLLECISKRGLNEVEVYKKAHLDRRIFSKLRNERNYMPSKRTLLAIMLAMELNLSEATEILNKAGYTLSTFNKEDTIIKFCFENKIYDLFTVNEILDSYGFKPL